MSWQIGDVARVRCDGSTNDGEIVTILRLNVESYDFRDGFYVGHEVDINSEYSKGNCRFEPHELIPIDDGNETTSWEEVEKFCGWRPKELVTVDA